MQQMVVRQQCHTRRKIPHWPCICDHLHSVYMSTISCMLELQDVLARSFSKGLVVYGNESPHILLDAKLYSMTIDVGQREVNRKGIPGCVAAWLTDV